MTRAVTLIMLLLTPVVGLVSKQAESAVAYTGYASIDVTFTSNCQIINDHVYRRRLDNGRRRNQ